MSGRTAGRTRKAGIDMTLEEKQEQLIAQINAIGDCFDQYSYLIVRSHDLPP